MLTFLICLDAAYLLNFCKVCQLVFILSGFFFFRELNPRPLSYQVMFLFSFVNGLCLFRICLLFSWTYTKVCHGLYEVPVSGIGIAQKSFCHGLYLIRFCFCYPSAANSSCVVFMIAVKVKQNINMVAIYFKFPSIFSNILFFLYLCSHILMETVKNYFAVYPESTTAKKLKSL